MYLYHNLQFCIILERGIGEGFVHQKKWRDVDHHAESLRHVNAKIGSEG